MFPIYLVLLSYSDYCVILQIQSASEILFHFNDRSAHARTHAHAHTHTHIHKLNEKERERETLQYWFCFVSFYRFKVTFSRLPV